jgi:hopene-associated glycosyltransferase HpnB
VPILAGLAVLAAVAWAYLLTGHGGYWRTDQRLPGAGWPGGRLDPEARPRGPSSSRGWSRGVSSRGAWSSAGWPSVVAVVPARNEAAVLPLTLPSLLAQDYPGEFSVVLVDDGSTDATAAVAAALGRGPGPGAALRVVAGRRVPPGWAGKVWAMAQGAEAAGTCEFLLFTDADIAFAPGTLAALVRAAQADRRALVSQMALLRADTGWERLIVPAFVYFFAQLYPFRRVNRPGGRTAAAAGGCMLVRREVLAAAGGLEPIRDARIDDVALGRLLKRPPTRARCWLGFSGDVLSRRPYPRLAGLWDMVARSAYTQLRYSPVLLVATVVGLLWLYAVPPAGAIAGLIGLATASGAAGAGAAGAGVGAAGVGAAGAGAAGAGAAEWCAAAGLAGWAIMAATYLPVLRLYRLSPWRAPGLPVIALLYAAMTVDSARRHYAGRGGEWKGRTVPAKPGPR